MLRIKEVEEKNRRWQLLLPYERKEGMQEGKEKKRDIDYVHEKKSLEGSNAPLVRTCNSAVSVK